MDAGLAAVLGALAGSVATIGAALATGWAQREGARITARSEHRRERREPRHAVYRELIEAATTLQNLTGHYAYFDDAMPDDLHLNEEDVARIFQQQRDIKPLAIQAALAGPADVGEVAMKLAKQSYDLVVYVSALSGFASDPDTINERTWGFALKKATSVSRGYTQTLDHFVSRAQKALDDDGSRR
ncbi:hypothetical protein [Streptomyces griseoflavus]|uniref:hypothetical protein n=1 Tax=Streptomyces griseoflavus TaxID=35619 RepID=UPI001319D11E|nr:hypothetical protein [Streptomyces griseoflavus]